MNQLFGLQHRSRVGSAVHLICVAQKTQEASPLNSRRSLQPTGGSGNNGKHSEGVPQRRNIGGASVSTGDPFRVDVKSITPFRGCIAPSAIER